ncbi:hypothetical protein OQA88_7206 [Cercophora sp. LCS_1]
MEVLGAVLAVSNVAIATTSSVWSLCEVWRDAPDELFRLLEDLRQAQQFFSETRDGVQSMPLKRSHATKFTSLDALRSLLDEGGTVIKDIGKLIQKLHKDDHWDNLKPDEVKKRRRALWLSQTHKVTKLRKRLKHITVSICRILLAQNVFASADISAAIDDSKAQIMTRIGERLEYTEEAISRIEDAIYLSQKTSLTYMAHQFDQMQHNLTSTVQKPIQDQLALLRKDLTQHRLPSTPTRLPTRTSLPSRLKTTPCAPTCPCTCHHHQPTLLSLTTPPLLSGAFGSLSLSTTTTTATTQARCSLPTCNASLTPKPTREVSVTYHPPAWLTRAALSLFYSSNLHGTPELVLRIFHRLETGTPSGAHNIFGYIDRGDAAGVQRLLSTKRGSIYDVRYARNVSPLFAATERKQVEIVKVLLAAGADPYQETTDGRSAITSAFQYYLSGETELAEMMPVFESLELSVLHMAVIGVLHVDVAEILGKPEHLGGLNKVEVGYAPLHLAAIRGDTKTARDLMLAGAEVDCVGGGKTPLGYACAWGREGTARLLVEMGADVNSRDAWGHTPLTRAVACDKTGRGLLEFLVERGADVDSRSNDGSTPLGHAIAYACLDAAVFLLERGADIDNRDGMGDTALVEGIVSGCHEAVRILLKFGCDVTYVNESGSGVLHHLAAEGDGEMMRLFTERRIRGLERSSGKTPLELFNERESTPELRAAFNQLLASVKYEDEAGEENEKVEMEDPDDGSDTDEFVDAKDTW